MSSLTSHTAWPIAAIRAHFPALSQNVHGKPLAYLDNAATTQVPVAVTEAMQYFYHHDRANVHRGVHTLSERATHAYEQARKTVARFIGAAHASEIVFTSGTTASINLVAQTYGKMHLRAGDEIVLSVLEHHSNIVPWQMLCEQTGAILKVIPMHDSGALDLSAYQQLLGRKTRLVAIAHASNALGTVNPIAQMIKQAHDVGAVVLIDGAQALAHLPVAVQELDCDFYAFSGHKLYGPNGIGILYGKESLLNAMPPYQGGGDMIRSVSFTGTTYNDIPYRFEAGTPNIAGAIGLAASLDYMTSLGLKAIAHYEEGLLQYATRALRALPGVQLVGVAQDKIAVLSFLLQGKHGMIHPHDIGTILDQEGVAIRAGHHCAQPLMERLGVVGTARASLAFYNTTTEIDQLVLGLAKVQEVFGA